MSDLAPRPWYFSVFIDDANKADVYDANDYQVIRVQSREADEESGMTGYTAEEMAQFIVDAVNARPA